MIAVVVKLNTSEQLQVRPIASTEPIIFVRLFGMLVNNNNKKKQGIYSTREIIKVIEQSRISVGCYKMYVQHVRLYGILVISALGYIGTW